MKHLISLEVKIEVLGSIGYSPCVSNLPNPPNLRVITRARNSQMNKIWANRLVAGTKTWDEMPASRQSAVKAILAERVADNEITAERYKEITGEDYAA